MKYLSILLVSSACLMSACSTQQATVVNPVSSTMFSTQSADTVPVTVTRDSGMVGAACKINVFVDSKQAASLRPADSVTLYVPAGKHILSVDTKSTICPSVKDAIRVNLEQDDPQNYRISFDINGNMQLLPTV